MANESRELVKIEQRLRYVLKRYEGARTRGDFLEALLAVHNGLEDAFNIHVGEEAVQQLSFNQKANAILPQLYARFDIETLNKQRNFYAHPRQLFSDEEIRGTAIGFVDLVLAAWIDLFGSTSQPPAVRHPSLSAPVSPAPVPQATSHPPALSPLPPAPQLQPLPSPSPQQRLAWAALLLGLALLSPVPWLAGFGEYLWQEMPLPWYWPLLITGLILGMSLLSLRYLWRFTRSAGIVRLTALLLAGLLSATLVLAPSIKTESGWQNRTRAALSQVFYRAEYAATNSVFVLMKQGEEQARALFPVTSTLSGSEIEATPGSSVDTPDPTSGASARVYRAAVPLRAGSIETTGVITTGIRVVVKTEGARLLSRAKPGCNEKIVAWVENRAELTVLNGPVQANGLTWWEVEAENGRGWSAADFLLPVVSVESTKNR